MPHPTAEGIGRTVSDGIVDIEKAIAATMPTSAEAAASAPSPASMIVRLGSAPSAVAARALVVLERGRAKSQLPAAWGTVFGNVPFADVLSRFLAEAQVNWSTAVLPDEHRDRFLSL